MKSFSHGPFIFPVIDKGNKGKDVFVLLHGFPATAQSWLPIADQLAVNGYRVLVPELRGYVPGARPRRRYDYRLSELADDVRALIDTAGVKYVHIVGHDWGGTVAWAFTSAYPDRVLSLTVISTPHPKAFAKSLWSSRQFFMSWYMIFFQLPRLPEWFVTHHGGITLLKALLRSGLDRRSAGEYVEQIQDRALATGAIDWYRALPYNIASKHQVGAIMRPTLFVYGGQDRFLSLKAARFTGRWVKGPYDERFLPNEGHWLPELRADIVAIYILKFIEKVDSSFR